MDKWRAIQVGGVTILVCAIGSHVWKDPGTDESHSHRESQNGPSHQMGRDAIEMAVSTGSSSGPPPIGQRHAALEIIRASWEPEHTVAQNLIQPRFLGFMGGLRST